MSGRDAGRILAIAVALGLVAQLLFYAVPLGLNLPLIVVALLATAWVVRPRGAGIDPVDVWLPVAAVILAAFVALRTDPALVAIDSILALALTAAAIVSVFGVPVTRGTYADALVMTGRLTQSSIITPAPLIGAAAREYGGVGGQVRRSAGPVAPVLRGLLIALPLLLIFTLLFSAADPVFAQTIGDLFTVSFDIGEVTGRLIYLLVAAWLFAGVLAFAPPPSRDAEPLPGVDGPAPMPSRLGLTEALVVLLAVDALFAGFVTVQATYLFGGRETLEVIGFTYAEYARRGFVELVVVALLAGGLLITIDAMVRRRAFAFVAAGVALCLLTGTVLVSAAMRLSLYQQAYGWTELRFYVLAAIIWLGVGVVLAAAGLALNRMRWLLHAISVAAVAVAIGLNVIGPQRFVAEQNVARALDPSLVPSDGRTGLDELYLSELGFDAVPAVLVALPQLPDDDHEALEFAMAVRLWMLDRDEGSKSWQAWNLARERAREALEGARDQLARRLGK